jgi:hypothetical protein
MLAWQGDFEYLIYVTLNVLQLLFCVELCRNINWMSFVSPFLCFLLGLLCLVFCLQVVEIPYCNIHYAFSYCIVVTEI